MQRMSEKSPATPGARTVLSSDDIERVLTRIAFEIIEANKGTEDLVLDHYLEVLVRKPGALAGSTALAAADGVTRDRSPGGCPACRQRGAPLRAEPG